MKNKNLSEIHFNEIILEVKRVTKVVKGGKNISFRALVAVGNKKGFVGIGIGKSDDFNISIQKAIVNGKKNVIQIPLTNTLSISHVIYKKHNASKILLLPAKRGTGIIAGGALRAILEIGGIVNIVGKQIGSNNIIDNAKATIFALKDLKSRIDIAKELSIKKNNFYRNILKTI